MSWGKDCVLKYQTDIPIADCITRICREPKRFGSNPMNPGLYDCIQYSDTQLLITFKGAQFGKIIRTEYMASFHTEREKSIVTMKFLHELFGLPPMTSTYQLDLFMEQRVKARRI